MNRGASITSGVSRGENTTSAGGTEDVEKLDRAGMNQKADNLTIRSVLDKRRAEEHQLLDAEAWLASLSEAGYAELRATTTGVSLEESPVVCAECDWPVYAPDDRNRRRLHFQHRKGFPETCVYSGAEGKDPRQVDAEKFNGLQEGERHKQLKEWLREVLAFSDTATGLTKERHVRLPDRTFARPDVYAENWEGAPIAFDIQLATTQMPAIIRREQFYERGCIRFVWITDRDQHQLMRRAFRDIYMRNGGQILGIDEEVLRTARDRKAPVFRIHRLVPGLASEGFRPAFKDRIYAVDEIDWGSPGQRPRSKTGSYDELVEWRCQNDPFVVQTQQDFFAALTNLDENEAGRTWDRMQAKTGGMTWRQLPCEPLSAAQALGVLATLSTGKLCTPFRLPMENEPALVNSKLLEPEGRRPFAELFEQVARATGRQALLEKPTVKEKLERAKSETMNIRLARNVGPVFDAFIPHGAFLRLELAE